MNREEMLRRLGERQSPWDMIIIGGGATGLGAAVDAASRGYEVVLLEQSDFAKGTSSRSTKLVHGGVRYLQQGNVSLVLEALRERGLLHQNAPHLVSDLAFIVPSYEWWESPFYGVGLKVYDMLAGRYGFGKSRHLSKREVIEHIPSISPDGLRGGTLYFDGQFDDARLAINLAQTAHERGATLLNYAPVVGLIKDANHGVIGVRVRDEESTASLEVHGKAVINATGAFADTVRQMDRPNIEPIIAPSQGVHIVLDKSFLPGDSAIMVPHTRDGRVMFAIPWHDKVLIGTTDEPIEAVSTEPVPSESEIQFILETANNYLSQPATRADIRSAFAGIRPLIKSEKGRRTASISRDHSILIDPDSGLITIGGGKWTTYRRMAEDLIDQAAAFAGLEPKACVTKNLPIHGHTQILSPDDPFRHYGSDAANIRAMIDSDSMLAERVHPGIALTRAEVAWACGHEMARTVDDVLARRSRTLLLDAQGALDAADIVAEQMALHLGKAQAWAKDQADEFRRLARNYLVDAN